MRNLVIMPSMANNRERMNLGEYAEEATIIMDEPIKPANHFIEANTQEVTLNHLKNDCITPVFSKDNELTINHAQFVETIQDAKHSLSSVVKRWNKPQSEQATLLKAESLKQSINQPINFWNLIRLSTMKDVLLALMFQPFMKQEGGNKLNLSIVGVRAYNQMNLYSKKVPELFRLAVGFKNIVCANLCIFTDGYKDDLRVSNTTELYRAALELFSNYNPAKHLYLMQQLGNTSMSEHQFCQIIGRMRLYQCLPTGYQKALPRMLLTDTQINKCSQGIHQ